MCSEESEGDNVLKVKPIPRLSAKVNNLRTRWIKKGRNVQSKWQAKRKITRETPERIRPDENRWIFKKENNTKTMHDCVYIYLVYVCCALTLR